jgi:thiol-disulfide isomerase/thioredoxin
MQKPKADYAQIQSDWLKNLKTFIETYPTSNDAAEALLQIAIAEEFAGNDEEAKVWYKKIASASPKSAQARKANGAIRRLDSPGKPLNFKGRTINGKALDLKQLAGRVVLVHYWASWCEPCKADMAIIRDLVAKYGQSGFYAVGVNVDNDQQIAVDSIKKARLTWPQIYETGGLESRPATELGILTLPTMLLLDKKGRVISRNIHISEVEVEIKKRAQIAKR